MTEQVPQHEWNAARVRKTFLEYFEKNGHTFGTASYSDMEVEMDTGANRVDVQFPHLQSSRYQIRHYSSRMLE